MKEGKKEIKSPLNSSELIRYQLEPKINIEGIGY